MRNGARRLAFCFVIAVSWTAAAAPEQWSIQPPAGWTDQTAEHLRKPEIIEYRKKLLASKLHVVFRFFADDQGHMLQVLFTTVPDKSSRRTMDNFEAGARNAGKSVGAEVSYQARMEGDTLVGDQVNDAPGGRLTTRRIAGIDGTGGMIAVQATCLADEATCKPILATLALDRASLQPPPDEDETSRAYQQGRLVGILIVCALVGVWIVGRLRLRTKR